MNNASSLSLPDELKSIKDYIRWGASQFNHFKLYYGHGTNNALDEAASLTLFALGLPYDLPFTYFDSRLTRDEQQAVFELIRARIETRKPAAYLTHEAFFAGLRFYVDERVLVPRSPIAELIHQGFAPWLDESETPVRVLDLCTGSACIAIALAYAFPETPIDAVDLSKDALTVAARNVKEHELEDSVRLINSNLYDALGDEQYDLIVSNPPYVAQLERESLPEEFQAEPQMGFDGGQSGLDLVHRILANAAVHLTDKGVLVVEVGSSADALLEHYPQVPFFWPEFEHGGAGVFILTADQIREHQNSFNASIA